MAIATEITRLQDAKVDIMAALVEKGVDVAGKNLVDVPDLIVGPSNVVRIGGHAYPYVKIGNLYWTAENLKEDVGQSVWYNNDKELYDSLKYGKLYNQYDATTLQTLAPTGWRLPSSDDFDALNIAVSSNGNNLKSTTGWASVNGNNESGFNAFPGGGYIASFQSVGQYANFWSSNNGPSFYLRNNNSPLTLEHNSSDFKFSVRLCKDA